MSSRSAAMLLTALPACFALSYGPVPVVPRSAKVALSRVAMAEVETETEAAAPAAPAAPAVEYSESMPFLVKRPNLKGYVGDVGFDPFGFSDLLPMDWLREAELKHARVCMLASVGFVFTDFYHFPGFDYTTLEAHDACVAEGGMSQILLWTGMLEVISLIAIDQMLRGSGRAPGDYGFDPVGFASNPEKLEDLQMKELANGRLAMFAFAGFVTQSVLTGNTFPYLYSS